jgi:hypothetical protein
MTVGVGTSMVTARFGVVSGQTIVRVTGAVLTAINVTPVTATVPRGTGQQFTATGSYADGTTLDITESVGWVGGQRHGGVGLQHRRQQGPGHRAGRGHHGPPGDAGNGGGPRAPDGAAVTVTALTVAPDFVSLAVGREGPAHRTPPPFSTAANAT